MDKAIVVATRFHFVILSVEKNRLLGVTYLEHTCEILAAKHGQIELNFLGVFIRFCCVLVG